MSEVTLKAEIGSAMANVLGVLATVGYTLDDMGMREPQSVPDVMDALANAYDYYPKRPKGASIDLSALPTEPEETAEKADLQAGATEPEPVPGPEEGGVIESAMSVAASIISEEGGKERVKAALKEVGAQRVSAMSGIQAMKFIEILGDDQ